MKQPQQPDDKQRSDNAARRLRRQRRQRKANAALNAPTKQTLEDLHAAGKLRVRQSRGEILRGYLNRPLGQSRQQFFREIGIDPNTFYDWLKLPEFRAGIEIADEQRRSLTLDPVERSVPNILIKLVELAKEGNLRAIELILQAERIIQTPQLAAQLNQSLSVVVGREEDRVKPQSIEAALTVIEETHATARRWADLEKLESGADLGDSGGVAGDGQPGDPGQT